MIFRKQLPVYNYTCKALNQKGETIVHKFADNEPIQTRKINTWFKKAGYSKPLIEEIKTVQVYEIEVEEFIKIARLIS